MITLKHIQSKLADVIKQSGMPQREIAEKLQVSQSCISRYLTGDIMPALDTFANLCEVLNVDPSEILCIDKF